MGPPSRRRRRPRDDRGPRLALQIAGKGRLEAHPPGVVEGVRFEGRFVIYALTGSDGPVFGHDVSLFDPDAVLRYGRGPQSAHFVCVRSGYVLEGFNTGTANLEGHMIGRTSGDTRLRIFYDRNPDGGRAFDDRASFLEGELVATYQAEEYFQIDGRAGVFDTRVNYRLLESAPFEFNGITADFSDLAPTMEELSHGHAPETDPDPEIIPAEAPFLNRGPGVFANHFPVGGAILAG
jgi:hypothetical protein